MDISDKNVFQLILDQLEWKYRFGLKSVCKEWNRMIPNRIVCFKDLNNHHVIGIVKNPDRSFFTYGKKKDSSTRVLFTQPHIYGKTLKQKYDDTDVMIMLYIRSKTTDSILNHPRVVLIMSDNKRYRYCYRTNWRIFETVFAHPYITSQFKYIGENINRVTIYNDSNHESLNENDIILCELEETPLEGIKTRNVIGIHMNTKIISLGIDETDCYYPVTIWDMI